MIGGRKKGDVAFPLKDVAIQTLNPECDTVVSPQSEHPESPSKPVTLWILFHIWTAV
jgi:hypothetical protein